MAPTCTRRCRRSTSRSTGSDPSPPAVLDQASTRRKKIPKTFQTKSRNKPPNIQRRRRKTNPGGRNSQKLGGIEGFVRGDEPQTLDRSGRRGSGRLVRMERPSIRWGGGEGRRGRVYLFKKGTVWAGPSAWRWTAQMERRG